MLYRIALATLATLFSFSVFAQGTSKLRTGFLAYQDKDFGETIALLEEGLTYRSELNEKQIAKAAAHLVMSYMTVYSMATRQNQNKELLEKYPNYAKRTYELYQEVKKYDEKDVYKSDLLNRYIYLDVEALSAEASDLANANELDKALAYTNMAVELHGEIGELYQKQLYQAFMIRGIIYVKKQDKAKATEDLNKTVEWYMKGHQEGQEAPTNIRTVYENLIVLHSEDTADFEKAIEYVKAAKQLFPEHPKWDKFELQLYQRNPNKLEEGLQKFEAALQKNPNDVVILINYATMIDTIDTLKAIELYKRAVKVDPNNFVAHFNLGGAYINQAVHYRELADASNNPEKTKIYDKKQEEVLKMAMPYMRKATELNPNHYQAAKALWRIALFLELEEAADLKKKMDSLKP